MDQEVMTLQEMNSLLSEVCDVYRSSKKFEYCSDPVASEDDSTLTCEVYFQDVYLIVTCDHYGKITTKEKKRKPEFTQLTLDDIFGSAVSEEKKESDTAGADKTTTNNKSEKTTDKTNRNNESEKAADQSEKKANALPEFKSHEKPKTDNSKLDADAPFKIGDIVFCPYVKDTTYVVTEIKGYTVRCQITGKIDSCYMTAADLNKVEQ